MSRWLNQALGRSVQDFGSAGSFLHRFSPCYFCSATSNCNYTFKNDKLYWLSSPGRLKHFRVTTFIKRNDARGSCRYFANMFSFLRYWRVKQSSQETFVPASQDSKFASNRPTNVINYIIYSQNFAAGF